MDPYESASFVTRKGEVDFLLTGQHKNLYDSASDAFPRHFPHLRYIRIVPRRHEKKASIPKANRCIIAKQLIISDNVLLNHF